MSQITGFGDVGPLGASGENVTDTSADDKATLEIVKLRAEIQQIRENLRHSSRSRTWKRAAVVVGIIPALAAAVVAIFAATSGFLSAESSRLETKQLFLQMDKEKLTKETNALRAKQLSLQTATQELTKERNDLKAQKADITKQIENLKSQLSIRPVDYPISQVLSKETQFGLQDKSVYYYLITTLKQLNDDNAYKLVETAIAQATTDKLRVLLNWVLYIARGREADLKSFLQQLKASGAGLNPEIWEIFSNDDGSWPAADRDKVTESLVEILEQTVAEKRLAAFNVLKALNLFCRDSCQLSSHPRYLDLVGAARTADLSISDTPFRKYWAVSTVANYNILAGSLLFAKELHQEVTTGNSRKIRWSGYSDSFWNNLTRYGDHPKSQAEPDWKDWLDAHGSDVAAVSNQPPATWPRL